MTSPVPFIATMLRHHSYFLHAFSCFFPSSRSSIKTRLIDYRYFDSMYSIKNDTETTRRHQSLLEYCDFNATLIGLLAAEVKL